MTGEDRWRKGRRKRWRYGEVGEEEQVELLGLWWMTGEDRGYRGEEEQVELLDLRWMTGEDRGWTGGGR